MKRLDLMLGIALFAVGSSAIYLWHQRTADHEQIAALQASLHDATAAARVATPSPALESPITRAIAETTSAIPAARGSSVEIASRTRASIAATKSTMTSPENVERVRALNRARASSQYPDLGKALDLSPGDESRLLDLIAQHQTDAVPGMEAAQATGESASLAFVRLSQAREADIASLLGSKYPQWKAYLLEQPTRLQVKDLEAVLKANGTPLSDAQSTSLVSAIDSALKEYNQRNGPGESPEKRRVRVEAASRYLAPAQQDAYRQLLDRQLSALDRPPGTSVFDYVPRMSGANGASPTK